MKFNKKKEGYTLIEAIISMAITIMILPVIINVFIGSISEFKRYIQYSIDLNNLDSAILNIDNIARSYAIIDISANDEKIEILTKQDLEKDIVMRKDIYIDDSKLIVATFDNKRYTHQLIKVAENILIRDIIDFRVIKKGDLIYYSIEMESGLKRIRCL